MNKITWKQIGINIKNMLIEWSYKVGDNLIFFVLLLLFYLAWFHSDISRDTILFFVIVYFWIKTIPRFRGVLI